MKSKEETTERKLRVVFSAEDVRSMMSVAIGRCDQIIKSLEGSSDPEDKDEIRSCEFLIAACGFVFGSKDASEAIAKVISDKMSKRLSSPRSRWGINDWTIFHYTNPTQES